MREYAPSIIPYNIFPHSPLIPSKAKVKRDVFLCREVGVLNFGWAFGSGACIQRVDRNNSSKTNSSSENNSRNNCINCRN